MNRTILGIILAATVFGASPALAQNTAWGDNGYISFNGLFAADSKASATTTDLEINQESTQLTTTLKQQPQFAYDFTTGGRVAGNLGVGFAFTWGKDTSDAQVTGDVPHPFFFNQPRALAGTTPIAREDLAIHIAGMWLLPITEDFQMAVFGGPTWFQITQQALTSVDVDDEYPFDAVTLGSVTTERRKGSRWGYNAGIDASYFFTQYLGIHGLLRYSRATIGLGSSAGSIEAGGVQGGGGLRIRY